MVYAVLCRPLRAPGLFLILFLCGFSPFFLRDASFAAEYTAPQALAVGDAFRLVVDAHAGDEATTEPKADANNGLKGDNPYFQRHNVARAHNDYWYTSSHQEAREPDPNGPQWVDYRPPLGLLGPGRYHITTQYRDTANRTSVDTPYIVTHVGGSTTNFQNQSIGDNTSYYPVNLGEHDLGSNGWVRIQDPGGRSVIGFHAMSFRYLGPSGGRRMATPAISRSSPEAEPVAGGTNKMDRVRSP